MLRRKCGPGKQAALLRDTEDPGEETARDSRERRDNQVRERAATPELRDTSATRETATEETAKDGTLRSRGRETAGDGDPRDGHR